jgi:CheY-like chemotaxis protein
MRDLLAEVLRSEGYEVGAFADGVSWLEALAGRLDAAEACKRWHAIISDVRMPGLNGLAVLRVAKQQASRFPRVLIITAFGGDEVHAEAERLGAAAVLDKPFELDDFLAKVRGLVAGESHCRTPIDVEG